MKRRIVALLLVTVLAVSVFAGCGAKSSKDSITAVFGSEPTTMDPGIMQTMDGDTYTVHLFEGLTRNDHGKFVGGVAKSWDISKDLMTYTFHLRDNAVWSDGKAVTAKDFEYAWKRNLDPQTASPYAYILYYVKGGEAYNTYTLKEKPTDAEKQKQDADLKALADQVGVKATDDKTLVVTLNAPTAYFPELCAFMTYMPLRQDTIEKNGDKWTQSPDTYITDGPYTLKEWKHNDEIDVAKSDKYWDKQRVVLNEIHFKLMDDENAALNATESGDIDLNFAMMPPTEIPRLVKEGKAAIYPDLSTYFYDFNTTKPPFNDVRVRKAFALAIDRQYIIDKVTKANQKPATAWVPFGLPDPSAGGKDFREVDKTQYLNPTADDKSIADAKKLLADAGYPDGKGFPEVEFIYNTSEGHKAIAEAVQEQLKKNLGVTIKLSNMEWAVFVEERNKHNFNFCRDGWGADYADPMTFLDMWLPTSGNNNTGWDNKEYDQLIATAKNSGDQKVRFDAMHKAEQILLNDMPVLPIYFYTRTVMEPKNLKGYYKSPMGIYYLDTAYFE